MPAIAHVEPLTLTRAVRGPFDYRLPEALGNVGVGALLEVPFAGRRVLGVVVGTAERSELAPERLASAIRVAGPRIPPELVQLATWLAEETCSTAARALALALAPGVGRSVRPRVRVRTALHARLEAAGARALAGEGQLTARQRAVLEGLRLRGPLPAARCPADHGALRRLAGRGLIALEPRELARRPRSSAPLAGAPPPALNADQAAVLARVRDALARPDPGRGLLLQGVTGSGKTEVYLQAAAAALASHRSVIVLVPEIALTPQTTVCFQARFGDTVAVLHSALTPGERHDEWRRLHRGEARVAIGPRSAVFAPVARLGLIVVDEEHDASYKHEGDPRYDARTVAAQRARSAGALLLCGSATPRPESVHALQRVRLPRRVDGRALPPVSVLDMRGRAHALHPDVRLALTDVRERGEKAVILLNRRGWSNFLSCRTCGRVWTCPNCDVSLVLHRAGGAVSCHHCGWREPIPEHCPDCASISIARHGAGTERLEAELAAALGERDFPVVRLDSDSTAGAGGVREALGRFAGAPGGVLLGTQMVAKGHDFPDVTLGVVLDADSTLRFPDFRAEERTFALIAQLAGRAGRGPAGGKVIVQTLAPEAQCIALAARHDVDGFLTAELVRRRALRYPPFSTLVRVVCAAAEPGAALLAAQQVRERLQSTAPARRTAAALLGPAPLFRLRGRDRAQLVIKGPVQREPRRALIAALRTAVEVMAAERTHRAVSFSVDVEPQ